MGFGFGGAIDEKETEKPKFKYSETLKAHSWSFFKVGQKVKSMNNGAKGSIVKLTSKYNNEVEIQWDNGNTSRVKHNKLGLIVFLKDDN